MMRMNRKPNTVDVDRDSVFVPPFIALADTDHA
jgi:hypothetical protein